MFMFAAVVELLSPAWLFVTPWTIAHQVPLSMGFHRREYWSRLSFPSPGDRPHSGIEPESAALADILWSQLGRPLCFLAVGFIEDLPHLLGFGSCLSLTLILFWYSLIFTVSIAVMFMFTVCKYHGFKNVKQFVLLTCFELLCLFFF